MAKSTEPQLKWYQERRWAAALVPACLLACYAMASLALNSGKLTQWFLAIVLLLLAVNRLAHVVLVSVGKARG